jgi:hypothetical protein
VYGPGQTVTISLNLQDTSSTACVNTEDTLIGGCYGVQIAADGGGEVWDSTAGPSGLPINCPGTILGTTIPGGYTKIVQIQWAQTTCTQPPTSGVPNPDCPETPVAPGSYLITGASASFTSSPAGIEITSS